MFQCYLALTLSGPYGNARVAQMRAIHDQGKVSALVLCLSLRVTCVRELGVVYGYI